MPKITTAYADYKGNLHAKPESAALADLAEVMTKASDMGISVIAKEIMVQRPRIEAIFASLDDVTKGETKGMQ